MSNIIRNFVPEMKKRFIMQNIATIPASRQLIVEVEDSSMLKDLKKAISMLRGVSRITSSRRTRVSAYEKSVRDLEEGRVYEYENLNDLIKEFE